MLTVLMLAGMILAVMLTTGRTVGAEQEVLGSIDTAGTRSITIRAEQAAGITSDVIDRIAPIDGIEWVGAFSAAVDAANTAVPDGTRVPARYAYGPHLDRLGIPPAAPLPGQTAYASGLAAPQLGLADGTGSITLTTGPDYTVTGGVEVPDFLGGLEPVMLIPQPAATGAEPVAIIIVIADRPDLVAPVSDAVLSVLAATDPSKITVQTSETLAQLRALIQGQLGAFSRGLVLAVLALTGALVAILLTGLVLMRRKDYGRRRALGATRGLIITLLLTQTALLAGIGILGGTAVSVGVLLATGDPLPGATFIAALGILALGTALLAALAPAITASRREPIRELRVP
ncbi:MAG: ABC transporter permease [Propioniciclava sp.]